MDDDNDEGREGVELLPSGTIRVWIEGTCHRMRRPKFRQYRQLRDLLQEGLDEVAELANELDADQRALADLSRERDAAGEQPLTADERAAQREASRRLRDRREQVMLEWWAETGKVLAASTSWPTDVDDLSAWMGATDGATAIVNHWRTVPSLSGVR